MWCGAAGGCSRLPAAEGVLLPAMVHARRRQLLLLLLLPDNVGCLERPVHTWVSQGLVGYQVMHH
jgi:hypothetical protein